MGFSVSEKAPVPERPKLNKESINKVFTEDNKITDAKLVKGRATVVVRDVDSLKSKLGQIESFSAQPERVKLSSETVVNTHDEVSDYKSDKKYPPEIYTNGVKIFVGGEAKLTVPPNEGRIIRAEIPEKVSLNESLKPRVEATMIEFEINGGKVYLPLNEKDINVVEDRNSGKKYYIDLAKDGSVNIHVESDKKVE